MQTANITEVHSPDTPPQPTQQEDELWCLDCNRNITPTPVNQVGFLYCALGRHNLVAVKPGALIGFSWYWIVTGQVLRRAGYKVTA